MDQCDSFEIALLTAFALESYEEDRLKSQKVKPAVGQASRSENSQCSPCAETENVSSQAPWSDVRFSILNKYKTQQTDDFQSVSSKRIGHNTKKISTFRVTRARVSRLAPWETLQNSQIEWMKKITSGPFSREEIVSFLTSTWKTLKTSVGKLTVRNLETQKMQLVCAMDAVKLTETLVDSDVKVVTELPSEFVYYVVAKFLGKPNHMHGTSALWFQVREILHRVILSLTSFEIMLSTMFAINNLQRKYLKTWSPELIERDKEIMTFGLTQLGQLNDAICTRLRQNDHRSKYNLLY